VLAAHRQFLPLEPPRADLASAGGTAAANLNGPRRLFYGGVRDLIIGIRVVQADGVAIRWGGKTVKNVAGYDMCKLFVGSLGTLGLITELTFKVFPLPEASRTLIVRGPDAGSVLGLAGQIQASPLLPAAMSAVNPEAGVVASHMAWGLLVRTEGFEAAVARHERDITAWAGQTGMDAQVLSDDVEATAWRGVRDFGWDASGVVIRLSAPPAAVPQVLEAVTALLPAAGMVAHLGTGTIWIRAALADLSPEALSGVRDVARRHDAHLLVARAPRSLKDSGDVWFPSPQALSLMQGLKQAFDPHGILNPGRFIAGL
jgi:glycolate oxidase FAD binding subunit